MDPMFNSKRIMVDLLFQLPKFGKREMTIIPQRKNRFSPAEKYLSGELIGYPYVFNLN